MLPGGAAAAGGPGAVDSARDSASEHGVQGGAGADGSGGREGGADPGDRSGGGGGDREGGGDRGGRGSGRGGGGGGKGKQRSKFHLTAADAWMIVYGPPSYASALYAYKQAIESGLVPPERPQHDFRNMLPAFPAEVWLWGMSAMEAGLAAASDAAAATRAGGDDATAAAATTTGTTGAASKRTAEKDLWFLLVCEKADCRWHVSHPSHVKTAAMAARFNRQCALVDKQQPAATPLLSSSFSSDPAKRQAEAAAAAAVAASSLVAAASVAVSATHPWVDKELACRSCAARWMMWTKWVRDLHSTVDLERKLHAVLEGIDTTLFVLAHIPSPSLPPSLSPKSPHLVSRTHSAYRDVQHQGRARSGGAQEGCFVQAACYCSCLCCEARRP